MRHEVLLGPHRADTRRAVVDMGEGDSRARNGIPTRRSIAAPGIFLGLGMGGFLDGIVLHQILQWHHMLSTTDEFGERTLANIEVNVMVDGLFHAVTWVLVAVGVAMLWRTLRDEVWRHTLRSLLGWMAIGWGAFNLVEGVVNHHVLQIHRVRPGAANPNAWDIGFLILGALLIVGGWLLQRRDLARVVSDR